MNENRTFSRIVNLDVYRANNPDLAVAGLTTNRELFEHLQEFGVQERRIFSEILDLDFYQANNNDLANLTSEELFNHFQDFGINESRLATPTNVTNNNVELASLEPTSTSLIASSIPTAPFPGNGNASPPGELPIAPDTDLPSFDPVGDDTGDVLNTSIDMAVSNFNITLNESVGSSDPNDYYRFFVENNSQFNLSVSGTSIGVEMYLDRNNDSQLETDELFLSGASGLSGAPNNFNSPIANSPTISFSGNLTDGTYYVRIFTSLEQSEYQLQLSTFNNFQEPVVF